MSYMPDGQEIVDSALARIGLVNAATRHAAIDSRTAILCGLPMAQQSAPPLPGPISPKRTINHLCASKFHACFSAQIQECVPKGARFTHIQLKSSVIYG